LQRRMHLTMSSNNVGDLNTLPMPPKLPSVSAPLVHIFRNSLAALSSVSDRRSIRETWAYKLISITIIPITHPDESIQTKNREYRVPAVIVDELWRGSGCRKCGDGESEGPSGVGRRGQGLRFGVGSGEDGVGGEGSWREGPTGWVPS
jgi:hypothetical protein